MNLIGIAFIRLRTLVWLHAPRRALLVEAGLCLLVARLALKAVPFRLIARGLGTFVPPGQGVFTASVQGAIVAREIRWAVRCATRHIPFQAICLPQALAALIMLRRRGAPGTLHFGAATGATETLRGHAWLDAGGVSVTGYPIGQEYTEIGCFVFSARLHDVWLS